MFFPIYLYDSLPQVSAQMSLFQRKLNLPFLHEIGSHPLSTLHPLCPALCFFGAIMAIDVYVSTRANLLQSCLTLCDPMDCSPPATLLRSWDSPGKNPGVGCHAFLQGINPGIDPLS